MDSGSKRANWPALAEKQDRFQHKIFCEALGTDSAADVPQQEEDYRTTFFDAAFSSLSKAALSAFKKHSASDLAGTHVLVVALEPDEGWTEGDEIGLRFRLKAGGALVDAYVQQHIDWAAMPSSNPTIAFLRSSAEKSRLDYETSGLPMDTWVRLLLFKYPHSGYTQWDFYIKTAFVPSGAQRILYDADWLASLATDSATGGPVSLPPSRYHERVAFISLA